MRMPISPVPRKTSATTDQHHAASVPTEISVSIVATPCLAFSHAARWNGQPPHRTTTVASASETHCQASNWSGSTIASTRTGRDIAAETSSRLRSARNGASASRPESSVSVAGSAAWYPASSTAAIRSLGATSEES